MVMYEMWLQSQPVVTESINISSSPLQGKDQEKRVVRLFPEKHILLLKIQNKQTGCEIKKFRLNFKNEIIVGDSTSVRETG